MVRGSLNSNPDAVQYGATATPFRIVYSAVVAPNSYYLES